MRQLADVQCKELLEQAADGYRGLVVSLISLSLEKTGLPQVEPYITLKKLTDDLVCGELSDNLESRFHAVLDYGRAHGWVEPRKVR